MSEIEELYRIKSDKDNVLLTYESDEQVLTLATTKFYYSSLRFHRTDLDPLIAMLLEMKGKIEDREAAAS